MLQWGRVVIDAESADSRAGFHAGRMLQWGRVVIDAESRSRSGSAPSYPRFNGAAS